MFVYIARLVHSVGDSVILGVGKTKQKAKDICERDLAKLKVEQKGNWEHKFAYYPTLNRTDGAKYTISDWVLEG